MPDLDPEPTFHVYRKENHPEIGEPPHWMDELDLDSMDADETFTGWDAVQSFLDEHDDEYLWNEVNTDTAPDAPLCPNNPDCDASIRTWSKQRLEHARYMHHIGTGH